jgi:transglutaminase-like putative cysteine protease
VARTALVYVLPALTIILAWVRIEDPKRELVRAVLLAALALAPALVRPLRARLVVLAVTLVVGSWIALGASPLHPGRVFTRLGSGAREFYDVSLPFTPATHPYMLGATLTGLFVFCVLLGLALAARRPFLACLAVAFGAGWPATLLRGGSELLLGGLIAAAVLLILAGLRPAARTALAPAALAGGLVVACALGLSSTPAVAKDELLHWQNWDLYNRPVKAVGVSYVWNSDYSGLNWPKKRTVVLKIKAPDQAVYWRATTLDAFVGVQWIEDLKTMEPPVIAGSRSELVPLGVSRRGWVKQTVTIEALRDRHLVGAERPVAYDPGLIRPVSYARGGIALVSPGGSRNHTYAVWSSIPHPTPRQLARSRPDYPMDIGIDRRVFVPAFGTPGRDAKVGGLIAAYAPVYAPLYAAAKRIVGHPRNPYAAVVAMESWLRDSGRFRYDEHPPFVPGVPALVAFVTETHRGYCQHFAGAMALMLRYLGIPARVAAGFSSGTYADGTWTVTDHDAHAWVEVWFRGYGWLPFDPTPGRGELSAPYSAASKSFDASSAAALVGPGTAIQRLLQNEASSGVRGEHARSVPVASGNRHRGLILFGLFVAALAALGLGLCAAKLIRRRARYLTSDPRRVAAACRRELAEILVDQRIPVAPGETLQELGNRLDEELRIAARTLVEAAGSARFASPQAASVAAQRVRVEARELRRVLRMRLSRAQRLGGALSLRSLRSA